MIIKTILTKKLSNFNQGLHKGYVKISATNIGCSQGQISKYLNNFTLSGLRLIGGGLNRVASAYILDRYRQPGGRFRNLT